MGYESTKRVEDLKPPPKGPGAATPAAPVPVDRPDTDASTTAWQEWDAAFVGAPVTFRDVWFAAWAAAETHLRAEIAAQLDFVSKIQSVTYRAACFADAAAIVREGED